MSLSFLQKQSYRCPDRVGAGGCVTIFGLNCLSRCPFERRAEGDRQSARSRAERGTAWGQSWAWKIRGADSSGIKLRAVLCCTMLAVMARPRGRTKPARLTVNLDQPTYATLVEVARREDVSVSWVVRRAIESLLARDQATPVGPALAPPADRTDSPPSGGWRRHEHRTAIRALPRRPDGATGEADSAELPADHRCPQVVCPASRAPCFAASYSPNSARSRWRTHSSARTTSPDCGLPTRSWAAARRLSRRTAWASTSMASTSIPCPPGSCAKRSHHLDIRGIPPRPWIVSLPRCAPKSITTIGLAVRCTGTRMYRSKSFLWVKVLDCEACGASFDLFPGYLVAENRRHPRNVLVCPACGDLNEVEDRKRPGACTACGTPLQQSGPARRNAVRLPPLRAHQPLSRLRRHGRPATASSRSSTTTPRERPGTGAASSRSPTRTISPACPMPRNAGGEWLPTSSPTSTSPPATKRIACIDGGIPATARCSIRASFSAWS